MSRACTCLGYLRCVGGEPVCQVSGVASCIWVSNCKHAKNWYVLNDELTCVCARVTFANHTDVTMEMGRGMEVETRVGSGEER